MNVIDNQKFVLGTEIFSALLSNIVYKIEHLTIRFPGIIFHFSMIILKLHLLILVVSYFDLIKLH